MSFGSPLLRAFSNARPTVVTSVPTEAEGHVGGSPLVQQNPSPLVQRTRKLQNVSTKAQQIKVLKWMQEEVEARGHATNIVSEAVKKFPEIFRAGTYTANIVKCARWWKQKGQILVMAKKDKFSISHTFVGARKRVELKAGPGRGRRATAWTQWLYPIVRTEFERLKKAGLKFSPKVLLLVARNALLTSPHPEFYATAVVGNDQRPLLERITARWVQQFQETQGIVHRSQTGKLLVSPAKTEYIERSVAYHMGVLARGFENGEFDENLMENMDETHFQVNMDNGRTLGFKGDEEVKYADIVCGGVGITMVVKVTGGVAGKIGTPFLIFQNDLCSYPIRGLPDTIPGVTYRTTKKSFMTSDLLVEYYRERRVSWADSSGRTKIQWMDNYPGHKIIPDCEIELERIKTQVRRFPDNATHLVQPCDSFVISKIKDAWTRCWEEKKMEMIRDGKWQGDGRAGTSGMLQNPGKKYFLELAAASVRDVNAQVDRKHGIKYARKAMIRCGMALSLNGLWEEKQLTPELQDVINKYRRNFLGFRDGLPPLEGGSIVEPIDPGNIASSSNAFPDMHSDSHSDTEPENNPYTETNSDGGDGHEPMAMEDGEVGAPEALPIEQGIDTAVLPIEQGHDTTVLPIEHGNDTAEGDASDVSDDFWSFMAEQYDEQEDK